MSIQCPAEGIYKNLSVRDIVATPKIATREEGPRVVIIQNILKAVIPSLFLIDIKPITHKSKIKNLPISHYIKPKYWSSTVSLRRPKVDAQPSLFSSKTATC